VYGYDFAPAEKGLKPIHRDVTYEFAPAIRYNMKDFLAAIDSRAKPVADIEQGYISTASCILANLSMKAGRTLTWDAQKKSVAGDDQANCLLRRAYRKPWIHLEAERA
jgi:Oxidoreductase family, C-terminal alpha/beta domain